MALLAVTWPLAAVAHSPGALDPSRPFEVEDATISRALYGVFEAPDDVFVIRLRFERDFAFPIELMVPHQQALRDHRPAFAIVGAGLPQPASSDGAILPRPLPAGAGAFVEPNAIDPRPAFYETFTRRFFWTSGVIAVVLPAGDYEIWVWSPGGTTGKFVVGFGVEERVDWREALENWSTYAY